MKFNFGSSNWPYTLSKQQEKNALRNQNGISKIPTMTQAIILGLGSMFNHSVPNQNVGWERDVARQSMTYTALRDIKKGEELCISYGQRLTFRDTEEPVHQDSDDWTEVMNYIDFIG
jgi:SET domain-containing protein